MLNSHVITYAFYHIFSTGFDTTPRSREKVENRAIQSFSNIMQNNNNQKQKQHQNDADPMSNEKEATDHEETATSSTSPPPKDVLHSDVCSICMDNVSMMDPATFLSLIHI